MTGASSTVPSARNGATVAGSACSSTTKGVWPVQRRPVGERAGIVMITTGEACPRHYPTLSPSLPRHAAQHDLAEALGIQPAPENAWRRIQLACAPSSPLTTPVNRQSKTTICRCDNNTIGLRVIFSTLYVVVGMSTGGGRRPPPKEL